MKWYDISDVDRLYAHTWGESIHFGHYDTGRETVFQATQRAKALLVQAAGIEETCAVLEVASGWGAAARYLAERVGARVVATNYSHQHARIAADQCADWIARGRILPAMADYHALPFGEGVFDIHWSQESLVHATDKARVFAEAFRVLKPGGRIVFTDQTTRPDRLDAAGRDRIVERHGSDDLWDHTDFLIALERAGFTARRHWDWTAHMARHFTRLYQKIETDRAELEREIASDILERNHAMWQWGARLAREGGIGYAMIVAEKPT